MIFLIEYDRNSGSLVTFKNFPDSQQREANESRLQLELELNRHGIEREIVLLEAKDEAALRRTHRRYFEDLATLGEPSLA
jgi:hypothetical protein